MLSQIVIKINSADIVSDWKKERKRIRVCCFIMIVSAIVSIAITRWYFTDGVSSWWVVPTFMSLAVCFVTVLCFLMRTNIVFPVTYNLSFIEWLEYVKYTRIFKKYVSSNEVFYDGLLREIARSKIMRQLYKGLNVVKYVSSDDDMCVSYDSEDNRLDIAYCNNVVSLRVKESSITLDDEEPYNIVVYKDKIHIVPANMSDFYKVDVVFKY